MTAFSGYSMPVISTDRARSSIVFQAPDRPITFMPSLTEGCGF